MTIKEFVKLVDKEARSSFGKLPDGVTLYVGNDFLRRGQVQMVMQSDDRSAEGFCRKDWPLKRIRAHVLDLLRDFKQLKAGQHMELIGHRS